jgi:manganese efflux pump family protein
MTVMIEAAAAGALATHSLLQFSSAPAPWPSRPLGFAALVTWLIDAFSGGYMLATWIARGGLHQQRTTGDRLAPRVVFTHFGIATTGLLVWISYLATHWVPLAWTAVGLLMLVIGLGISTVTLWTPFPAHRVDAGTDAGTDAAAAPGTAAGAGPADGGYAMGTFPVPTEQALTDELTDEMLNRALTDEVLLGQLVDDVVAGVRAAPPRAAQGPRKHLVTVIPAGHGLAAIATFLLAVLTAAGAS